MKLVKYNRGITREDSMTVPHDCKHQKFEDIYAGEILCQKCGMVFEEKTVLIETEPKGYVTSTVMPDVGSSTIISTKIEHPQYSLHQNFHTMKKWDNRIRTSNNKNKTLRQLNSYKPLARLGLPEYVIQDVQNKLQKVQKDGWIRGRKYKDVCAGVTYHSCKTFGIPKTMNEISTEYGTNTKSIFKVMAYLNDKLGYINKVSDINSFVTKYVQATKMPIKHEPRLRRMINKLTSTGSIQGKSPIVIIATLIWYMGTLVDDFEITKVDIAKTCGVTEVVVRTTANSLNMEMLKLQ